MLVLIVERFPESLRGDLTRWLLEPHPGVFVGRVSAEVRDRLWERVINELARREAESSAAVLVYAAQNEQGYEFRVHGDPDREVMDFEGLWLVRRRHPEHD